VMIAIVLPATSALALTNEIGKNSMLSFSDPPGDYLASIANTWTQQAKLLASDGGSEDRFGYSVSIHGDTALIGAPEWTNTYTAHGPGSAYIFTRTDNTWKQQQKLTASDGEVNDQFGRWSVSLDGDTALIGAPGDDRERGSAYVFIRTEDGWKQQQKLTASDGTACDQFGCSVSLDGNTALIGAKGYFDLINPGSAYVFIRTGTTWKQQQKLTASDGTAHDLFGGSVSLDGNTAIIGAAVDTFTKEGKGSAYIFALIGTTWKQQQKLTASDGVTKDHFGRSVSLDGNTAIIGASGDDDFRGSAYVFTRTGSAWKQQQKILPSDRYEYSYFGKSVSLFGYNVLIGSWGKNRAYVFACTDSTWTQQQELTASDYSVGDSFGFSVSLDGNTAIIGSNADNDNGIDSGSAYIFTKASENKPPDIPTLRGETNGITGVEYTYNASTTDPNNDQVMYLFDWGDGTNSGWVGPYDSGATASAEHTWTVKGSYSIKVKAKDIYGEDSSWKTLAVTMPRSREINNPLFKFLQKYPIIFQMFQQLLKL